MLKLPILLLLTPILTFGQTLSSTSPKTARLPKLQDANSVSLPTKEGKIVYEEVDSSVKMSKDQFYNASKLWFANSFVSAQFVLQAQVPETGELIGKGTHPYFIIYGGVKLDQVCQFTIRISCRSNKYRVQIYDISNKAAGGIGDFRPLELYYSAKSDGINRSVLKAVDEKMSDILVGSKKAISKKDEF